MHKSSDHLASSEVLFHLICQHWRSRMLRFVLSALALAGVLAPAHPTFANPPTAPAPDRRRSAGMAGISVDQRRSASARSVPVAPPGWNRTLRSKPPWQTCASLRPRAWRPALSRRPYKDGMGLRCRTSQCAPPWHAMGSSDMTARSGTCWRGRSDGAPNLFVAYLD
jgi:hypothetical protein